MIHRIRSLGMGVGENGKAVARNGTLAPLRAAAAQLLMATGAGATLEQVSHTEELGPARSQVPAALAWAPLLVGPLAAAANIEHARRPTEQTSSAVRFLTLATIGLGGCVYLADALRSRERPPTRLAPLAFASVGLLSLLIDRQEEEIARKEKSLRRRARVVERLVPRRRGRLDRIVVHV